jgi:hypothetical protein
VDGYRNIQKLVCAIQKFSSHLWDQTTTEQKKCDLIGWHEMFSRSQPVWFLRTCEAILSPSSKLQAAFGPG